MAKKKKQGSKKHRISPAHLNQPLVPVISPTSQKKSSAPELVVAQPQMVDNDAYATTLIRFEVRRVLMLASIFIGIELILSWLFGHTGLGNSIYNAVKL